MQLPEKSAAPSVEFRSTVDNPNDSARPAFNLINAGLATGNGRVFAKNIFPNATYRLLKRIGFNLFSMAIPGWLQFNLLTGSQSQRKTMGISLELAPLKRPVTNDSNYKYKEFLFVTGLFNSLSRTL